MSEEGRSLDYTDWTLDDFCEFLNMQAEHITKLRACLGKAKEMLVKCEDIFTHQGQAGHGDCGKKHADCHEGINYTMSQEAKEALTQITELLKEK